MPLTGGTRGASLGAIVAEFARDALHPPERLSVAQAAEKYRMMNNVGSYVGPYLNATTPYLVEPMEVLTSREFDSMVFVGPAQAGKSDVFLNWVTYSVMCDPNDVVLFEKSQGAARDFSFRRLARLHRHNECLGNRVLKDGHSDNVFDKVYRSGMMLSLSWPAITELSGRPIPRVWMCDYDRMPQDIDGEGSPFDLGRKRTTTFGASAMTVAESSPGFVVDDPKWVRATPHEAPPCKGVLALYNRGDRRRWQWKCPHCGSWFEPSFDLLKWDHAAKDALSRGESAMMLCPNSKCGVFLLHDQKPMLNQAGRWVKDGQWLDTNDRLQGTPFRSKTASFWMKGVAAAFASWTQLVSRYVQAEEDFAKTGEQQVLKSVVNTDLGEPYYLRGTEVQRNADELKRKALPAPEVKEGIGVPLWVRFLIATVDIQKNRFVVQVTGIGPREGGGYRMHAIDFFPIVKSARLDDEGEKKWVRPHVYQEDWLLLRSEVLEKRYWIEGNEGTMSCAFLGYDSGGMEGVTDRAYGFWRSLRKEGAGEHKRVFVMKGDPTPSAPRTHLAYPDSKRKTIHAGARGEIPVLLVGSTIVKDALNNKLERTASGDSDREFSWQDNIDDSWFHEMCAEYRDAKGWQCPKGARNEAWDCSTYAVGLCIHLKVDRVVWDSPHVPYWAKDHDANPYVELVDAEEKRVKPVKKVEEKSTLKVLAASLA